MTWRQESLLALSLALNETSHKIDTQTSVFSCFFCFFFLFIKSSSISHTHTHTHTHTDNSIVWIRNDYNTPPFSMCFVSWSHTFAFFLHSFWEITCTRGGKTSMPSASKMQADISRRLLPGGVFHARWIKSAWRWEERGAWWLYSLGGLQAQLFCFLFFNQNTVPTRVYRCDITFFYIFHFVYLLYFYSLF